MARKAVAQELSRERILEEARDLFAAHGYRALTMRSIARAMGYSHGALYYHFKEKAELFYALIRDDFNTLLRRQKELMSAYAQPSIVLLQNWMLEFIRFGLDNPNHYELMFMFNDVEITSYSRTEQAQCLDLFSAVVREVVAGYNDNSDVQYTLPWSLFMSLHGFISYSIHYKQTYAEAEKLAEDHVHFLCRSLKATISGNPNRSRKTDNQPESAVPDHSADKTAPAPTRETA